MKSYQFSLLALPVAILLMMGHGCASTPQQKEYSSPEAAAGAMIAAVESQKPEDIRTVFGIDDKDVISSGDPVADANDRAAFIKAYYAEHHIQIDNEGVATLVVGHNNWPFPVPMIKSEHGWIFDTPSGLIEIANRRIGRNELETIQTCLAVVDAENDYRTMDPEQNGQYAMKFFSAPGTKNGLFWATKEGEPASPLGELVADASSEGYTHKDTGPSPYHGYRFSLTAPADKTAADGYIVIAWPAEYRKSGVMTFYTNQYGIIYQKDLGEQTPSSATTRPALTYDNTWTVCSDTETPPPDSSPANTDQTPKK